MSRAPAWAGLTKDARDWIVAQPRDYQGCAHAISQKTMARQIQGKAGQHVYADEAPKRRNME